MGKKLIVFSDGTGNSASKFFKTNVWRLYDALNLSPASEQIALYDDGVGSSSFKPLAIIGGAFGWGLKRNILNLYIFLSRHYAPADAHGAATEIYGFGFSRGAFTIRVLVGLIVSQGLLPADRPDAEMGRLARRAYRKYRRESFSTACRLEEPFRYMRDVLVGTWDILRCRKAYGPADNVKARIRFLGLWDTVGAYGMPVEQFRRAIDMFIFPLTFTSRKLSHRVRCARHALSIDEERTSFAPILWERNDPAGRRQAAIERHKLYLREKRKGKSNAEAKHIAQENTIPARIQQTWFAGVHANVGGGYPDDRMSSLPLAWMLNEASKAGLVFRTRAARSIRTTGTPFGRIYDSRSGLGAFYGYQPRTIPYVERDDIPMVHESVIYRLASGFQAYAPIALPEGACVMDQDGRVFTFRGFTQEGGSQFSMLRARLAAAPQPMPSLAMLVENLKAPTKDSTDHVHAAIVRRRAAYFGTLFPVLGLLGLPLLRDENDPSIPNSDVSGVEQVDVVARSWLAMLFDLISGFTPSYLTTWLDALRQHPVLAIVLAGLGGLSFVWSRRLKVKIADRARAAWTTSPPVAFAQNCWAVRVWNYIADWAGVQRTTKSPSAVKWTYADIVSHSLANNRHAIAVWNRINWGVVPLAFASALVVGAAILADRAAFRLQSSLGFVCQSQSKNADLTDPPDTWDKTKIEFDTKKACQATGVKLSSGQTYRISVTIDASWSDQEYAADLSGVDRSKLGWFPALLYDLGIGFRRVLSEPWFKPMARIGDTGHDEYPLTQGRFLNHEEARTLEAVIKARSTGELFLFVNDAYPGLVPLAFVLGMSHLNADASLRHTYGNNKGSATVQIRRER